MSPRQLARTRTSPRFLVAPRFFDRLPIEIIHMILRCLGFYCGGKQQPPEPPDAYFRGKQQQSDQPSWYSLKLQTLLSLCLVCKRLRDIVQPILYHDFMLGYGDSWCSDLYTWDGRLTSFMRTVAQRRDLAALVKRIFIHPYLLESFGEERIRVISICTSVSSKVIRANPRQYISEREAWGALQEAAHALGVKSLEQLSSRDLITVLIMELPNLEHCSLEIGPYEEQIVPSAGLHVAGISQLPLTTIDVSLRSWDDSLFYLDERVGSLLDVSTRLETLNLHMCRGSSTGSFPSLPNLKSLNITFSRFSERDLYGLLSSCHSLHTFLYEATHPPWEPDAFQRLGYDHFRLSHAVRYLSLHCQTLEFLHLDLRQRGLTFEPPETFNLKQFTVLKHLFLNLDEFHSRFMAVDPPPLGDRELLVRILPSSIISLHLAGHITPELPRLENSLSGLARAVLSGQFPNLKQIRWNEKEKLNDIVGIRSDFATAGVSFDYDRWPISMPTLEQTPPTTVYGDYTLVDNGRGLLELTAPVIEESVFRYSDSQSPLRPNYYNLGSDYDNDL